MAELVLLAASAITAASVTTVVTNIVVGIAVSAGLGMLARSLAPSPAGVAGSITTPEAAPINGQRDIPVRQPIPPRRFVYGECRIGGVVFFQENVNPNLYIGLALSDGTIEGVTGVYFGDENIPLSGSTPVTGNRFAGYFEIETATGLSTQTASTMLTAAFPTLLTSDFRQRGVARAVVRLDWGDDAAQHNALWGNSISPSFIMKGVKVFDPRNGGHVFGTPSTWAYSTNPALCVAHALTQMWTSPLAYADIDWTSVSDAANVCDTLVTVNGASRKIFECAGVFQAGADIASQISDMLTSMGGALIYSDGKFYLRADQSRSPVITITDDDIISLGEYIHEGETRTTPNAIKATYYDAEDAGTKQTTPVYEDASAVTADGGLREMVISCPFTPHSHSAQILAFRELRKARDGRQLTLQLNDIGLFLQPLEVITISSTSAAFLNGEYEVVQVDVADVGANLVLRGYVAGAYDNPGTYVSAPPPLPE